MALVRFNERLEVEILLDPRTLMTPTGFGIAVGEGPPGDTDDPHIWAISKCCAAPIHFRYKAGVSYNACSSCGGELKFGFPTSGTNITHSPSSEIERLVRTWTGLDQLEVKVSK